MKKMATYTPMSSAVAHSDISRQRVELLAAVAGVRHELESGGPLAERSGTLPQASVDALSRARAFHLKLPQCLGGIEADLITQMQVIEALAYIEPSAAWCAAVGATGIGEIGAFVSDAAVQKIFADRIPIAGYTITPTGEARKIRDGYMLNGRWAFASGIRHAHWVLAGALVTSDNGAPPVKRCFVFPVASISIIDNWDVAGLKGTGSCDYTVSDLFVPEEFTWTPGDAQRRGGALYRLERPAIVAHEHAAFAIGVAQRALDELLLLAQSKRRGMQASTLAMRPVFQRMAAEGLLKLKSARSLAHELFGEAWNKISQGESPTGTEQAAMRAAATFATQTAVECCNVAFRFGGGTALQSKSPLQKCLRDINAAAQHIIVNDISYENYGQFLLGIPGANAMA